MSSNFKSQRLISAVKWSKMKVKYLRLLVQNRLTRFFIASCLRFFFLCVFGSFLLLCCLTLGGKKFVLQVRCKGFVTLRIILPQFFKKIWSCLIIPASWIIIIVMSPSWIHSAWYIIRLSLNSFAAGMFRDVIADATSHRSYKKERFFYFILYNKICECKKMRISTHSYKFVIDTPHVFITCAHVVFWFDLRLECERSQFVKC